MLKRPYVRAGTLGRLSRSWERAVRPHGRPVPRLRPERAGLLIVDMQRHFLDRASPAHLPAAPAVLPVAERLLEVFRSAGRPVAFGVYVTRAASPMAKRWRRRCPPRSRWAELGGGLSARRGERVFRKPGYSALRGTDCGAWFRSRGVRDLVVAGVMTNLCVEATVRDAFDAGLGVFVPLDGCAAGAEDVHVGSLKTMACGFASVVRSEVILNDMRGSAICQRCC